MLERLLIVGLGSIGIRHVRVVRGLLPCLEIVALRHQSHPGANPSGVDRCVTSVSEALKCAPQAAVIANPSSHHLEAAMPLAQAGLHLLVEKPISASTKGVAELVQHCSTQGLILMTGYNLRFSSSLLHFRVLLQEKRVGRIYSVQTEVGQYLPAWRPGSDYRETVSARAALGGGVLLELSHEIDYLRWLFGEVASVTATLMKQSCLEMDVEDTAHLVMSFEPQMNETPVMAFLTMDCVRQDPTRTCTVIGETGSLRWNALAGMVEVFDKGASAWETVFRHQDQKDETYEEEWRHFLSCIAKGRQPVVSGHDGLAVLRVIEAARLSAKTGMTVAVCSGSEAIPTKR